MANGNKKAATAGHENINTSRRWLFPVYHLTAGMKQSSLVKTIQMAFESGLLSELNENLPDYLLKKYRLMPRQEAVRAMHFPDDMEMHKQALRRVKFEELFTFN